MGAAKRTTDDDPFVSVVNSGGAVPQNDALNSPRSPPKVFWTDATGLGFERLGLGAAAEALRVGLPVAAAADGFSEGMGAIATANAGAVPTETAAAGGAVLAEVTALKGAGEAAASEGSRDGARSAAGAADVSGARRRKATKIPTTTNTAATTARVTRPATL